MLDLQIYSVNGSTGQLLQQKKKKNNAPRYCLEATDIKAVTPSCAGVVPLSNKRSTFVHYSAEEGTGADEAALTAIGNLMTSAFKAG